MHENLWTNEEHFPPMLARAWPQGQEWAFEWTMEIYTMWMTKLVQCVSLCYLSQRWTRCWRDIWDRVASLSPRRGLCSPQSRPVTHRVWERHMIHMHERHSCVPPSGVSTTTYIQNIRKWPPGAACSRLQHMRSCGKCVAAPRRGS